MTVAQLRLGRGLLVCANCAEYFDALAALSEEIEDELKLIDKALDVSLPLSGAKASGAVWPAALLLGLAMLMLQIGYFEGHKLLLQQQLRTLASSVCDYLHCQLPPYKNLESCIVLQSALDNNADDSLRLSAAIINTAAWSQTFPAINLILEDLNGHAVAQRVFSPQEYAHAEALPVNEAEEISMSIVPPVGVKIGGYTIALL